MSDRKKLTFKPDEEGQQKMDLLGTKNSPFRTGEELGAEGETTWFALAHSAVNKCARV